MKLSSKAPRKRTAVKAEDGKCCTCLSTTVEYPAGTCLKRKDRTHCVHWWEGPYKPPRSKGGRKR